MNSELRYQTRHGSGVGRGWLWFRHWRRTRPFWAGVLVILGGLEILSIPLAPLAIVIHEGVAGVSGELFGALLVVAGGFLWFAPRQRHFMGVLAILLSLTTFITSNFGGFFLGMLLGLVGGSLAVAWTPLRVWGLTDEAGPDIPSQPGAPEDATLDLTTTSPAIDLTADDHAVVLPDVPDQGGRHRRPSGSLFDVLRRRTA